MADQQSKALTTNEIALALAHMGLRSGVQEMAGRDARRYQIVGTDVPAGAGFPRTRE
jgi:hypothetical protein